MTPDQGTLHSVCSATEFNPCGLRAARIKAHVGRSIAGWRVDVVADEKRATSEKEIKKKDKNCKHLCSKSFTEKNQKLFLQLAESQTADR